MSNLSIQQAFANACTCWLNGTGRSAWDACGLDKQTADDVWQRAYKYVCNE